jgi:hypothetical protein
MARLLLILLLFTFRVAAVGQSAGITLTVPAGGLGLDGFIRPGDWAGLAVDIDNPGLDDIDAELAWLHRDQDGDTVAATRRITLTRQRTGQRVWLYAAVPITANVNTTWAVRLTSVDTGELLASLSLQPGADPMLSTQREILAVTSNAELGLNDYLRHETRHAPLSIVRGLSLDRLPDRWMGLYSLKTFIWTQDLGGDPADPLQTSEASLFAMREWVARGGHLVVVLPAVGQTWTGSPLADMLPLPTGEMQSIEEDDWPVWLGGLRQEGRPTIRMTVFREPSQDSGITALLRDRQNRPVALGKRYGFGRVTLMGLDLTQPALIREGLPTGERRLWNTLFGWVPPAYQEAYTEAQVRNRQMRRSRDLPAVELASFVDSRISMTGTVGVVLIGAIGLFSIYWLVVGVVLLPLMKAKQLERYTWVAFVAGVLLFAGVAWGGAALLKPGKTSISHFSVIDIDGRSGLTRVQSDLSLFVPNFENLEVGLPAAMPAVLGGPSHSTISSTGLNPAPQLTTGFPDAQTYRIDAADPRQYPALPMRATSKQLRLEYLGDLQAGDASDEAAWDWVGGIAPVGDLELGQDGTPTGRILHHLPETLQNVSVIYCPGEAYDERGQRRVLEPLVWRYRDEDDNAWAPGEPLELTRRPDGMDRLVVPLTVYGDPRQWDSEGWLGKLLGMQKGSGGAGAPTQIDDSVIARRLAMLSFYDRLPPPNYRDVGLPRQGFTVQRTVAHRLDLSPLTQDRRLIIIGHLPNTPLPAPLTVDDQTPPSEGWTMVRWVYDF